MRNLILCICVLLIGACAVSKVKEKSGTGLIVGNFMDEKAKAAFDGLKKKYASAEARGEYVFPDRLPYSLIRSMDSLDLEVMSYYEFDYEKFYLDPSPETLLKCLEEPDDKVYFSIKKDGEITYSLIAVIRNGVWQLGEFGEGWENVIAWLPVKLAEAGTTSYKIFRPCGLEYVVYMRNGEPVFCRITGEEVAVESMCESFVNMIRQGKEDMENRN